MSYLVRKNAELVIENSSQLLTLAGASKAPKTNGALMDIGVVRGGAVAVADGKIIWTGRSDELRDSVEVTHRTRVIDAEGKVVMPGFVDCHTHPVFAGSRFEEWLASLSGRSYTENLKDGKGIIGTVKATKRTSSKRLLQDLMGRLDLMLAGGTTTVEAKSGYGLTAGEEVRILEVIREAGGIHKIGVVPTFMGAHAVPPGFAGSSAYARHVVAEMVPEVTRRGLAKFCDVFCETGAFSPRDSMRILSAGREGGLAPKIHTNQFSDIGGIEAGAEVGATSMDHLDHVPRRKMRDAARSGSIAVLMPSVPFFLGLEEYADARGLVSAGAPIALATDFNPGTSYCLSMPFIVSLSCIKLGLTPEEAISAATINAAHALGIGSSVGSIEVGKRADILVLNVDHYAEIPYHLAINPVAKVIKGGKIVAEHGRCLNSH